MERPDRPDRRWSAFHRALLAFGILLSFGCCFGNRPGTQSNGKPAMIPRHFQITIALLLLAVLISGVVIIRLTRKEEAMSLLKRQGTKTEEASG